MIRARFMVVAGLWPLLVQPAVAADAPAAPVVDAPAAAAPAADRIWHERSAEANLLDCGGAKPPAWCPRWLRLMEAGRTPVFDPAAPEWRRVSVVNNLHTCAARVPPDWCREWRVAMDETTRQAPYGAALEAYLASEQAKAEVAAFERAKRVAWQAIVDRVAQGLVTPGDKAEIERLVKANDLDAMELQAWMHVQGVGVRVRDFVKAYELYAQAVLAGRKDLQPNLDKVWPRLTGMEKEAMLRRFGNNNRAAP